MTPSRLIIAAMSVTLLAGVVLADTTPVYVNAAATGANSGSSWPDAYTDLQLALQNAPAGSQIWVAQGTYYPGPIGSVPTTTFSLRSGIAVYGGFDGDEVALEQRDPAAHPTILSGDLGRDDPASRFDNTHYVVRADNVEPSGILDGFTIRDGFGPTFIGGGTGAGLLVFNNGPTIRNCLFIDNHTSSGGGAAVNAQFTTTLSFTDCRFESNTTATGDFNTGSFGNAGGAVFFQNAAATFSHCLFVNNRTGNGTWGGCQGGSGRAGGAGGFGGAAAFMSSTVTLDGCRFYGNITGDGGVGASCTFRAAPAGAGGSGAAIFIMGGSASVISCVFDGNRTGAGGPATNGPSGPVPAGPPGSESITLIAAALTLANGTFVGNRNPTGTNLDVGRFLGTNSIVWSPNDPGTPVDPLFVEPDGPDNVLGTPDDDLRLHRLSPYIDAGDNALVPVGFTTDTAGNPRFIDIPTVPDTGSGTPPIVDWGAYETPLPADCRADFNASGAVSVQDIFDFLAAYFANSPTADFNQSGAVSVEDIFPFLAAYFSGC